MADLLGELADRDLIVINPQVVKEYAHNIIRKFPRVTYDQLATELETMRLWCRAPLNAQTAIEGLDIHRRYMFSYYDSCLLASALQYGCDMFLSEDMAHKQEIRDIRIFNPFADDPRGHIQRN